jgi:hypothetical protein
MCLRLLVYSLQKRIETKIQDFFSLESCVPKVVDGLRTTLWELLSANSLICLAIDRSIKDFQK